MEQILKIEILEKCWKESLNWTFDLLDVLKSARDGKRKITDIEKTKSILLAAQEKVEKRKNLINSESAKVDLHTKVVINFKSSLERLLNSTEIDLSKSMKIPPKPFDLFYSLDEKDLDEFKVNQYIEIVEKNLEENWVSFNQTLGRMLIRMKMNGFIFE